MGRSFAKNFPFTDKCSSTGQVNERTSLAIMRKAYVSRRTKETQIEVHVDLDGTGRAQISTGVGFFDHMLEQLARHSLIDMEITTKGDLHIDAHHTVEDTGIALGQALRQALGDMRGITRFADAVIPMDETLTRIAIDLSGRPYLVFKTVFPRAKIGDFDTELVREFFQALTVHLGMNLHIETLYGENSHHISESSFKGVARALRQAMTVDARQAGEIPSTKGTL
jgi:imidazoleglycerol-phosphate dehydratase